VPAFSAALCGSNQRSEEDLMHNGNLATRLALGGIALASIGLRPGSVLADTVCGSTAAGWNAPNGAAVFEIAPGIITDLLQTLGEQRSHSMLSHGPDGWVTHATSITPPNVQNCDTPVDASFMAASTPGLSTIDQGAAYTFLYSNGGAPTALYYQRAATLYDASGAAHDTGPIVGNTFLGSASSTAGMQWTPMGTGANTVWGLSFTLPQWLPRQIYYGWNQYMNIGSTASGFPQLQTGETAQGDGVVCSTALTLWQHDALWNSGFYTGDVLPRHYSISATQAAANQLWNDIYNKCSGATNLTEGGSFGAAVWSGFACLGISVCSNAANQIVNAFASDLFVSDIGSEWQNIVSKQGAVSASPDDVGCWSANSTGAPCSGPGSSIWGWDGNNLVQWNSGGNSYGCWQQ
jgi:hypothetical protein